jgi:hypothetical protein
MTFEPASLADFGQLAPAPSEQGTVSVLNLCSAHRRLIVRLPFLLTARRRANHHPAATPRPNIVPLQASIIMRSDIVCSFDLGMRPSVCAALLVWPSRAWLGRSRLD